jgi:hypothetical protein
MDTCKHNVVVIYEMTSWIVNREKQEYDISDEEFDEVSLRCVECKAGIHDGDMVNEVVEIIEKGRGNE